MHEERILALAEIIERLPLGADPWHNADKQPAFGMGQFQYHCGSPSCIAGWADHLAYKERIVLKECGVTGRAKEYLGIGAGTAEELFLASRTRFPISTLSPKAAAWCLRNLVETGRVAWTKAVEATKDAVAA